MGQQFDSPDEQWYAHRGPRFKVHSEVRASEPTTLLADSLSKMAPFDPSFDSWREQARLASVFAFSLGSWKPTKS